jgi:membrane protease YdiL (CAAX protease family)
MNSKIVTTRDWFERVVLAVVFTAIGSLIMIVFSPWYPILEKVNQHSGRINDYLGRIALLALLLIGVFLIRRSNRLRKYWLILFGLFVLAAVVTMDRVFGVYVLTYLNVSDSAPVGWAMQKLSEVGVVVCVILALTKLSGESLGSIYLQKGNLKWGLIVGGLAFLLFAVSAVPVSSLLFGGKDLTAARIIPWIPWLLIFIFANATLEELMFRGLFLRKLEPFFGKFFSNFLVAFVFTVLHKGAFYTTDQYLFLAILLPLALGCGYIAQKSNALWGSILMHAGMDIPLMIGIFSNLP